MLVRAHDGPLPGSTVAQVLAISQAAADHDAVAPLGEQTLLDLADPGAPARHLVVGDPPVGYASLDLRGRPVAELVVAPASRRRGLGRALLAELRAAVARSPSAGGTQPPLVWAHGNLPAAQALAASAGLTVRRELWQMRVDLGAAPTAAKVPDDVVVRAFRIGQDEDAWLEVNARAFAGHPEQGRMTRADLRARQREPWFRAADLLLAERDGRLQAFAWLKLADGAAAASTAPAEGELYALGVDPDAQGSGLGRLLTSLALDHLVRRGARVAVLYTEATNAAAIRTYAAAGFERSRVDVQYG